MIPERSSYEGTPVDIVVRHPAIVGLGVSDLDQRRIDAFAVDLARWLWGRPRTELGPLAHVITIVAQREFRATRQICKERPLMAVEASARATAALWPWLRDLEPPPAEDSGESDSFEDEEETEVDDEPLPPSPPEEEEDSESDEPESSDEEEEDGSPNWLDELPLGDDPDLDNLIERFRALTEATNEDDEGSAGDAEEQAAQMLTPIADAAAQGAIETDRVARQLERFLPGIGWSSAPGQLELTLLERLDQLASLLESLGELQDLADALGRLEDATEREGRQEGGREEVVGVRLGGEVSTALPGELALLGDPDTEDLFYQRLLERRLVSLELTGTGDEGRAMGDRRGPVIACIDTSASMEGPPELAAKALVLAVCRKVIPKGRTVHLILFGGPGEQSEIRLRRGLGGLEGMLAFLQRSFHSGTDFDGPLLRAMDLLEEQELEFADVLVVTDGLCRAAESVVDRVAEVRAQTGLRVWSVVLGHRDARGVEPFSDDVLMLDPTEAAQASGFVRRLGRR
ncbi:MAG: VWA domain-containing protein [Myxococcota bacterium]